MKTSRITVKELSELSGYSVSTVSKALNNKKEISTEVCDYIKTLAKEYNYIPNKYALALRGIKTKSIAVVLPSVMINEYNRVLYYLQQAADTKNFRVVLYQTFNSKGQPNKYINSLDDGSIDGVFLISNKSNKTVDYKGSNIPLIRLDVNPHNTEKEIKELSYYNFYKFLKQGF